MRRLVVILLILLSLIGSASAQGGQTLTVVVPSVSTSTDTLERALDDFQAEAPDVQVQVVAYDAFLPGNQPGAITQTADQVRAIASRGDVILMNTLTLTPATTLSGAVLDLAPLRVDATTGGVIENAFAWNSGLWGLPVDYSPVAVLYDADALQNAGVVPPRNGWDLPSLASAAAVLGPASVGMEGGLTYAALAASTGDLNLTDTTAFPAEPDFSAQELSTFVTTAAQLRQEGLLVDLGPELETQPPLLIASVAQLGFAYEGYSVAPLAGNTMTANINGWAVSSGSPSPALAYELAQYLTTRPDLLNTVGTIPARPGALPRQTGDTPFTSLSADLITQIESYDLLQPAEIAFGYYLPPVIDAVAAGGTPDLELDQTAQTLRDALTAASNTEPVVLNTPEPPPAQTGPGITLNFGVATSSGNFLNRNLWESLAAEFAQNDTEVGEINFRQPDIQNMSFSESQDLVLSQDCAYVLYAQDYISSASGRMLDLGPLVAADPTYDPADQVTDFSDVVIDSTGREVLLPMAISPAIMAYHAPDFEATGLPLPATSWTSNEFLTAAQTLGTLDLPYPAALIPQTLGPDFLHLERLAYSLGGQLIDYRPFPSRATFTDPATVDAVRQILDLARAGTLRYERIVSTDLSSFNEDAAVIFSRIDPRTISDDGQGVTRGALGAFGTVENIYTPVLYPAGPNGTPYSYLLSAGFISAETAYPEACYRWLRFIQGRGELFGQMPALRSSLESPALSASVSPAILDYYTTLAEVMADPTAQQLPGLGQANAHEFALRQLIARAFDAYVLDGADLLTTLTDAQTTADQINTCLGDDLTPEDVSERTEDCVDDIVPELFN